MVSPGALGLESLTDEQRAAACARSDRILILAGAGTGKTRTLVARVEHLLSQGVAPEAIQLVTFTLRAAGQVIQRLSALGPQGARVQAGTFHALAYAALRRRGAVLGLTDPWTVAGPEDQADLMSEALTLSDLGDTLRVTPRQVLELGSLAINTERTLEETCADRRPAWLPQIERVDQTIEIYAQLKAARAQLDFDDLLLLHKALLLTDRSGDSAAEAKVEHVLVDEYQDTTPLQAELAELAAAGGAHLAVVGDDAQAIYGFRGARVRNILEFPSRGPCQTFSLTRSFRCQPHIVRAAQALLQNNREQFHTPLVSQLQPGTPNIWVQAAHPEQQALFVGQRITELQQQGLPLGEIAVLYRNHAHGEIMQLELTRTGTAHEVRGGRRLLDRAHLKSALAYLRICAQPQDASAWRRVLSLVPGVGAKTQAKILPGLVAHPDPLTALLEAADALPARGAASLRALATALGPVLAPGLSPADRLQALLHDPRTLNTGYLADLERRHPDPKAAMAQVQRLAVHSEGTEDLLGLLAQFALNPDLDAARTESRGVTLSTVHQAKGLEWSAVFILGLAEGWFPSRYALDEVGGEQEERRLLYVAMTRAKHQLYLCHPTSSGLERGAARLSPARYLFELPVDTLERWSLE